MEIHAPERPPRIDPYGIAANSGRWYLIADDQRTVRLCALERLSYYKVLDAPAALRHGQTLCTMWAALKERARDASVGFA